MNEVVGSFLR